MNRVSSCNSENMKQEDLEKLDGKQVVPATFHMIQMMGWKDDPEKQPQPKKRGSGKGLDEFVKEMIEDDPSVADRIKHGVIQDDTFRASPEAPLTSNSSSTNPSKNGKSPDSAKNQSISKSPFE